MPNPANPFSSFSDDDLIVRLRRIDDSIPPTTRRQLCHAAADRITDLLDRIDGMLSPASQQRPAAVKRKA